MPPGLSPRAAAFQIRAWILSLLVGLVCFNYLVAAQQIEPVFIGGHFSNRFNIVFLSEGYTPNQLAQFRADATNALRALLDRSPFREYRGYINAYTIPVASAQSGADHPAYGAYRDTFFNASYDSRSDRLITIPPHETDPNYDHGQGKVEALLRSLMPRCHLPVLLVNDPSPGGSDGSGLTAITYRGAGLIDILAHEVGHVGAGLGDEYTDPSRGYPDVEEPNTTRETNHVKWAAWIAPGTPIPTPPTAAFSSVVGVFQGAHYHETGWYRPKLDCTMNHPTYPDYCEVCREALVLALYHAVRPVEAVHPAPGTLFFASTGRPQLFELILIQPSAGWLTSQWYTNGARIAGATNTACTLSVDDLGPGAHTLSVSVQDLTPFVRNDSAALLAHTVYWPIQIAQLRCEGLRQLSDGRVVLGIAGFAPHGFVTQSSADLITWQCLSTNMLTEGVCWVTNFPGLNPQQFFRALCVESVQNP